MLRACVVESVCVEEYVCCAVCILVLDEVRAEGRRMRLVTLVGRTVEQSMKMSRPRIHVRCGISICSVIYIFINSFIHLFIFYGFILNLFAQQL